MVEQERPKCIGCGVQRQTRPRVERRTINRCERGKKGNGERGRPPSKHLFLSLCAVERTWTMEWGGGV